MKNIKVALLHRPESIIGEEPNRYETCVDIESNFKYSDISMIREFIRVICNTVADHNISKSVVSYIDSLPAPDPVNDRNGFMDDFGFTIFGIDFIECHKDIFRGVWNADTDSYNIYCKDKFILGFNLEDPGKLGDAIFVRVSFSDYAHLPVRGSCFSLSNRITSFIEDLLIRECTKSELDNVTYDGSKYSIALYASEFFDKFTEYGAKLCRNGIGFNVWDVANKWREITAKDKYPGYQILDHSKTPSDITKLDYSVILESKTQPIIKFNGKFLTKTAGNHLRFRLYGDYKRAGLTRILDIDTTVFDPIYFKPFDHNNPEPENIDEEVNPCS